MLSRLLTYGKFGSLFCGIEHTTVNGSNTLNALTLKKKKDEFLIENTLEPESIAQLSLELAKAQHAFLIINTSQVLSKTLTGIYEPQKAIANAFPNLNIEEFYFVVYTSSENTFVSICRKGAILSILKEYESNNLNVIGFSLGSLASVHLSGFVKDITLQTTNSNLTFSNQEITEINSSNSHDNNNYNINGLDISNKTVLALAGILGYYTKLKKTVTNFESVSKQLKSDFEQKRLFSIGLKSGLAVVFTLLLISFLFFSSYTSKINTITTELQLNNTYKNSLINLTDEVSKKERLVTDYSLASSKTSWYLDQIGNSVPGTILLSDIQFQSLVKNMKKETQVLIQEHTILIKGKSRNSSDFLTWTTNFEQADWVEKVTIQDYGTGKTSKTEFELLIELKK